MYAAWRVENVFFTVEVPVSEHKKLEVKEVKMTKIKSLEDYETFELGEDIALETIGSYWVVTKKEKHDGQKTQYKARLVARGFQEIEKPQSDSPTVLKESLKVLIALAANEDFDLASMDIGAAFLQGNTYVRL